MAEPNGPKPLNPKPLNPKPWNPVTGREVRRRLWWSLQFSWQGGKGPFHKGLGERVSRFRGHGVQGLGRFRV